MSHHGLSSTVGHGPHATAGAEDGAACGSRAGRAAEGPAQAPQQGAPEPRGACALTTPDTPGSAQALPRDEVDVARAREYALLATLLARPPDGSLLQRLARLEGDDTPLGAAHKALAGAAAATDEARAEREYFELFIGMGRGELLPYASYYLTGFLHARPLAQLRGDLKPLGLGLQDQSCEPEDHAAVLCEIMARLADSGASRESERDLFLAHLAPWIGRFFLDLERARSAKFYARVGALGRTFTEIETAAFSLPT